jgi:hypothetical protein
VKENLTDLSREDSSRTRRSRRRRDGSGVRRGDGSAVSLLSHNLRRGIRGDGFGVSLASQREGFT